MKLTHTTYQDSPCWQIRGRWLDIDADWNMRFPFGISFSLHAGRQPPPVMHQPGCKTDCLCDFPPNRTPGFLLDVNAPLGEPNRLYLWLGRWHVTIGLLSFRGSKPTGKSYHGTPVYRDCLTWPHIDGRDRYRYHKNNDGKWERNEKPAPMHWGWLTIENRGH